MVVLFEFGNNNEGDMRFGNAAVGVNQRPSDTPSTYERKESNMDGYYCIPIRSKNTAHWVALLPGVGMRRKAILTISIRFCDLCEKKKKTKNEKHG